MRSHISRLTKPIIEKQGRVLWSGLSPTQALTFGYFPKMTVVTAPVFGSRTVLSGRCINSSNYNNGHFPSSTKLVCQSGRVENCAKVRMSLGNQAADNRNSVCGYFLFDLTRRVCNYNRFLAPGSKDFHGSPATHESVGAARDISFHASTQEEQAESSAVGSTIEQDAENSAVSLERKVLGDRTLTLLSGSCYLPHPAKEKTGGEDAHFICVEEQAIGVADGVGGWAEVGIDSGLFSRELMSNSVSAIQDEPKGSIDPARVLERAYSGSRAKGSSTACIIALNDQGLHAINLGDSGFVVIRDGSTVFKSPVQQHSFNFTYQLQSGNRADLPGSGQVFTVPVIAGDVIVAATDGLFDNLYNNEITAVVVHSLRSGFEPQVTAQKIAALARQRALDRKRQTPFSAAAQEAGYLMFGGKLDDCTVVVSYVKQSSDV